jgi:hypothetical protein
LSETHRQNQRHTHNPGRGEDGEKEKRVLEQGWVVEMLSLVTFIIIIINNFLKEAIPLFYSYFYDLFCLLHYFYSVKFK